MGKYVALLRGINVGGNNLIKMIELKACFEKHGFRNVVTYIQSGNVVFRSRDASAAKLTKKIEDILSATFDYRASVVLCSDEQLRSIVKSAPTGFGTEPARYRYDVLYLKAPLEAAAAIKDIPVKEGVDRVHAGPGAVYFSRLIKKATQSRLSKVASMPIYKSMTIRNWNTTKKLLEMLDERDE